MCHVRSVDPAILYPADGFNAGVTFPEARLNPKAQTRSASTTGRLLKLYKGGRW